HRRSVALHAQKKVGGAAQSAAVMPAAAANQDLGNIAVIDDSAGVIDRLNPFDLDRKTLIFQPSASGYSIVVGGDTFDTAALSAGAKAPNFGDDDTRSFGLPFAFPFFGSTYRQIWVNSNGNLTFRSGDTDASGSYGHFYAGLPSIAPLFTDLD